MVQMPPGIPVATFAIGEAGATNAALFAVALLAASDDRLTAALGGYRAERRAAAAAATLPPTRLDRRTLQLKASGTRISSTLRPTSWPMA